MPIAQSDIVVTMPDSPVTIAVLDNDSGTELSVTGLLNPVAGSVILNSDQTITYTPSQGFVGTDSFSYTVQDGDGLTAQGLVQVTVALANEDPVAENDSLIVFSGSAASIDVLANDSDADDDTVQIVALSAPGHGEVSVNRDLTLRYEPQQGFVGSDSFSYTISDGRGGQATGVVNISVVLENQIPNAVPDTATTVKNVSVTFNPLANDFDLDGDAVTFSGLVLPVHGNLSVNGDLTITYTPEENYIGSDSFSYQITDGNGGFASSLVTLVIHDSNSEPTATNDVAQTFANTPVNIDILSNDIDPDSDDLEVTEIRMPMHGTVAQNQDGTLTYSPNIGFLGADSFDYTISDGRGGSSTANVSIDVQVDPNTLTFDNGYSNRRKIVVPGASVSGTSSLVNFPFLFSESGDWLKSVANGGKVENGQYLDLRFEDETGLKLDHEIEKYDPIAGSVTAWVSLPAIDNNGLTLVVYYGKANVSFSEELPNRVWRDYLAVYHLPSEIDRTGMGRDLSAQNLTTSSLLADAAEFNGSDSNLTLQNTTWLDGHTSFAMQMWVKPSTTNSDQGMISVGPINGLDSALGLGIRYDAQGFSGGGSNVITIEQQHVDGRSRLETQSNIQTTENQSLAMTWSSGSATALFVDGSNRPVSFQTSAFRSGATQFSAGPLIVGAGAKDTANGGWNGLIDEVRFRASDLSADWIATEYANHHMPAVFYGTGGEDVFGDSESAPVAVPDIVQTEENTTIEIDVLANDLVIDESSTISIQSVAAPSNGTTSINNGMVTYQPDSDFSGNDQFEYTIVSSNGKTSKAVVFIEVISQSFIQSGEDLPYFGRYYGFAPFGHGFADTRLNVSTDLGVSNFFYASKSGFVDACRFHRRTGVGYSSGDGGRYTVRIIEADENTKLPISGGVVMSETNNYLPGNTDQPRYPTVALTPLNALEAKKPYCFVWINTHADPTGNNFAQNNDIVYQWNDPVPPQTLAGQPSNFPGEDFWTPAVFNDGSGDKPLFPYPITYYNGRPRWHRCGPPLIDFRYIDGQWGGWGSWGSPYVTPGYLITFNSTKHLRERFRVSRSSRTVRSVWLNLWRLNAGTGSLVVTLEQGPDSLSSGNGSVIEQVSVPASTIFDAGTRFERDESTADPDLVPWVEVPFSQNRVLELGQIYSLRVRTASGTMETTSGTRAEQQGLSPIHNDFDTHEANRTMSWLSFDDSMGLQLSTNSGSSWAWNGNRRQMPCLFECVV